MELNEIISIIEKLENSNITDFYLKEADFEMNIVKKTANITASQAVTLPENVIGQIHSVPAVPASTTESMSENTVKITSPLVGIYYEAASPEAPPFKRPGDTVKEGEVVCILEAMKVFNEIKSPWNGIVKEVLVSNQDIVEYDQTLMIIERTN
ncbi:acetyl-CoA carboxylase biotin carboxyl carrier protein [Alkalibacter mobilis]|uniref:acetyl-CoA carboxylase biotin carboxyl carrier protein n=1 Tax=Alkalibacter mobilis TaxID=2787712 RepID=UPI00189E1A50|nr:acetyl-CoA carboxylase biotin carboxyl carrier protein [Alkalibacter mobilis]MBF7095928.1 acetyl-CoA carboxylase biotin carboxyl carrier protein [Alkalibacter mobilis]